MINSGVSKKRQQCVELVGESHDTKLFVTQRVFGRQIIKKHYIVLNREPQFTLETRNGVDFEFIRLARNNKLVGRLKNGQLERRSDVDKVFFLSKLDLTPKSPSNHDHVDDDNNGQVEALNPISTSESSLDDDQYQSSTSSASPRSAE